MARRKADNWQQLLDLVEVDDGLPVRESGYWAEYKLFFWNRYVAITTTAMVGKPVWSAGVVYIDLFSGPGVCIERKNGRRFPGSPLIAANAPKPFERILLCEINPAMAIACCKRLDESPARNSYQMFEGDCNLQIDQLISRIPQRSLALAFIDPTGLHVHFGTVRKLANRGPTDLLVLFPDAVDILRNEKRYFDQPDSNLDLVLGTGSDWRQRKSDLNSSEGTKVRRLYSDIYKDQLRKWCGYEHFGEEVISGRSGPLYRLVFATKHETGLKFWDESVKKDAGGQGRLF